MSAPVFTSLDPLTVRDTTLDIGHGNWRAGGDLGELTKPKWMAVVFVDGVLQRGQVPGMPSVPASTVYPGELNYDARLMFPLDKWKDGKEHTVKVWVYAAQFFQGWGDSPEDRWEWGHFRSDDGTTPAVLTTKFTLGSAPAPAPAPNPAVTLESAQAKASGALYELVEQWRAAGRTDDAIFNTLVYQLIRAMGVPQQAKRNAIRDAIKGAIAS